MELVDGQNQTAMYLARNLLETTRDTGWSWSPLPRKAPGIPPATEVVRDCERWMELYLSRCVLPTAATLRSKSRIVRGFQIMAQTRVFFGFVKSAAVVDVAVVAGE